MSEESYIEEINNRNKKVEALRDSGNLEEALELAISTYEHAKKKLDENSKPFFDSLDNLAALNMSIGNHTAAEPLYRYEVDIVKKYLGTDTVNYGISVNKLAVIYKLIGNYEVSKHLFKVALDNYSKFFDDENETIAIVKSTYAHLHFLTKDYKNAEKLLLDIIRIKNNSIGPDYPEKADDFFHLATVYEAMEKNQDAVTTYEKAIEILSSIDNGESEEMMQSLNNAAMLYVKMGDFQKAKQLYKQFTCLTRKVRGEESKIYWKSIMNLSILYDKTGNSAVAQRLKDESSKEKWHVLGIFSKPI